MSIEHCQNNRSKPNWGVGHVRSAAELEVGTTYVQHGIKFGPRDGEAKYAFITTGRRRNLLIQELPTDGQRSVRAWVNEGRITDLRDVSFAELGFKPDVNGGRVIWDWLEDPSRTKPSLMEKLLSAYPEYFSAVDGSDFD